MSADLLRFIRGDVDPATFSHEFARANPHLLDKAVLSRWYPRERLMSDAARRTFLLPEPRT